MVLITSAKSLCHIIQYIVITNIRDKAQTFWENILFTIRHLQKLYSACDTQSENIGNFSTELKNETKLATITNFYSVLCHKSQSKEGIKIKGVRFGKQIIKL